MSVSFSWPPASALSRVILVTLLDLPLSFRPQLIKPLTQEIRKGDGPSGGSFPHPQSFSPQGTGVLMGLSNSLNTTENSSSVHLPSSESIWLQLVTYQDLVSDTPF